MEEVDQKRKNKKQCSFEFEEISRGDRVAALKILFLVRWFSPFSFGRSLLFPLIYPLIFQCIASLTILITRDFHNHFFHPFFSDITSLYILFLQNLQIFPPMILILYLQTLKIHIFPYINSFF